MLYMLIAGGFPVLIVLIWLLAGNGPRRLDRADAERVLAANGRSWRDMVVDGDGRAALAWAEDAPGLLLVRAIGAKVSFHEALPVDVFLDPDAPRADHLALRFRSLGQPPLVLSLADAAEATSWREAIAAFAAKGR